MTPDAREPPLDLRVAGPLIARAGLELARAPGQPAFEGAPASRLGRIRNALLERRGWTVRRPYPLDFDEDMIETIERVRPYTITSSDRLAGLIQAVEHVVHAELRGAIVECGVWRGGSMMAAALTLRRLEAEDRDLHLFDTFAGMSEPTAADVTAPAITEDDARTTWNAMQRADSNAWCYANLDEVELNLARTGYPAARIHLVKGKVEDTIPSRAPSEIAVLRLDTDWYESTAHELEQLYPRLCAGGVLIIDDYGHWSGARKAVDEYFGDQRPYLHRLDYTGRLAIKP